jgi:hypothetical protein
MSSFADAQTRDANAKLVHKSVFAKANFSGGSNEASVLFSFSDLLPALVGSSRLVVDAKLMLPKVKKFSDWYSEGHIDGISVYSRWSKACSGYNSTLVCELDRRWNQLDQAELRAYGLDFSMRTKAFINEFNTFVKEFRTELLIEEDGADDEEAWSLLTAMLSAICKTMCAACAEAGNNSEKSRLGLARGKGVLGYLEVPSRYVAASPGRLSQASVRAPCFDLAKGDTDVRVVYTGTLSGLNASLWAPYFPLPTIQSHLRIVEPGTYMADNNVGECFQNWILDERVRKWCGIDLTSVLPSKTRVWERWERCAMGLRLRPSPYVSVCGCFGSRRSLTAILRTRKTYFVGNGLS